MKLLSILIALAVAAMFPALAMVIEGERSIPSTVESARVFAQTLPDAELVLVPNAGHYPQVEQSGPFFAAVSRFLTAGAGGRGA